MLYNYEYLRSQIEDIILPGRFDHFKGDIRYPSSFFLVAIRPILLIFNGHALPRIVFAQDSIPLCRHQTCKKWFSGTPNLSGDSLGTFCYLLTSFSLVCCHAKMGWRLSIIIGFLWLTKHLF
ncbi:hypothetical protein PILCRDRAFT_663588 [Piloderma croceum F 1598]|uniref:Uncharacterized protein n=1 Tax=Piloderma croceum (strain F 1598) TaxID=765440 RepID=A0A0C3F772_PILCF|nr:hypothetical protein PILCRDRAFT_663588 [Piloderma croceum F 1598]